MGKYLIFFAICLAVFQQSSARPSELGDGQELLAGRDTRYYGYPFFWFGRPLYDDNADDNLGGNGGLNADLGRKSSTLSIAAVGAGWGR